MAWPYITKTAPDFSNTYISTLVASIVYDINALNGPLTYVLQGSPGTMGTNGLGGSLWAAQGAASAFANAVNSWTAVCNIRIEPYPFYYNGSGSTAASWVETLEILSAGNTQLGQHELPYLGQMFSNQLHGEFNKGHEVFTAANNAVGGYSFTTFIHEIGHALGLDHPHEGTPFPGVDSDVDTGDFGLNQSLFTIMSYNDGYTGKGYSPSYAYGWMTTPGAFDIAAVQAIYGANMSTHASDDVYLIPTANQAGTGYACIWDAGGTDTISGANATAPCVIDLREATLLQEEGGGGWLSSATGIFGGFTIANGAKIENAVGGAAGDVLVGNTLANHLSGGGGNDTLYGNDGDDTLDGGAGADALDGGNGNDNIVYDTNDSPDQIQGGAGQDKLLVSNIAAPTHFNLVAHGFESAQVAEFDTGGQSWSRIVSQYSADWQLSQRLTLNDDGSTIDSQFDLGSLLPSQEIRRVVDPLNRLDTVDYFNDDGTRVHVDLDQANASALSVEYLSYDAQERLDLWDHFYDDGRRVAVDFDQANASSLSLEYIHFDEQSRLDVWDHFYDDGSRSLVDFDQRSASSLSVEYIVYDTASRLDFWDHFYDDGSRAFVNFDQAAASNITIEYVNFDQLGRLDYVDQYYDDGGRTFTDVDQAGQSSSAYETTFFDASGHAYQRYIMNDDGASHYLML